MQTMVHQGGDDASDHSSIEGSAEFYSCSSGPPPSSESDSEDDVSSGPIALQFCSCDANGPCYCDALLFCSFCGSIFEPDTHCPLC